MENPQLKKKFNHPEKCNFPAFTIVGPYHRAGVVEEEKEGSDFDGLLSMNSKVVLISHLKFSSFQEGASC